MTSTRKKAIKLFLTLAIVEGLICLIVLMLQPGGSGAGSRLDFSPLRLVLIGGVLLLVGTFSWVLFNSERLEKLARLTENPPFSTTFLIAANLMLAVFVCGMRSIWLIYKTSGTFAWRVAFERGLPLAVWLALIAVQGWALIFWQNRRLLPRAYARIAKPFLILIGVGAVFFSLVAATRIGLVKDNAFFGKPTVPLLEWHLAAAFLLCLIVLMLAVRKPALSTAGFLKALPFLIWAAAAAIWLAIPNQHGFFSPAGRAPNFEVYPFSDGSFYGHYARSLAAGMGYKGGDIPPRPLYIVMLAVFHQLAGNDYDAIIRLQTLVIALLPALIYLIGKDLHSVGAGLAAALLCILRETNAILSAPFAHNVSSTKYFFSDLPTAVAAAFFVLLLIRWQRAKALPNGQRQRQWYALLSGGALGMMSLIRTQSLSLVLIPLGMVLFSRAESWRLRLRQVLLFSLALLACLSPWLIRNQQITGKFVFDHPTTQIGEMAASYNLGGMDILRDEGMNDGAYAEKLTNVIWTSIRNYPAEIASFITAHFINNEISNLRLLPVRDRLTGVGDLLRPAEPFWEEVSNDALSLFNLIALMIAYAAIAFGTAASVRNDRAGWIPLAAILIFNFSTAVGRYSAGRYLIPVDWILFLYLGISMAEWLTIQFQLGGYQLSPAHVHRADEVSGAMPYYGLRSAGALVLFLLVGLSLPLAESIVPMKFEPELRDQVLAKLEIPPDQLPSDSMLITKAIAIYPRYYAAGEGEPESAKQGYGEAPYGRLIFLTLAPGAFGTVELPLETAPDFFPDGSTVWLTGSPNGATTLADTVLVETEGQSILYTGALPPEKK